MSEIGLGIIGAGHIAQEHLKVIKALPEVKAIGITSRTLSKAEELARKYDIDNVYDTTKDMLKKVALDGIMVLVSAEQTYEVVSNLIPERIPLFIEKPPGLDLGETSSLVTLADQYGTQSMVGFNRRYYSVFHKGIDVLKRHGELLGVVIEGHERFWKTKDSLSQIMRDQWVYGNSTHTIDLLRFFGGEPRVVHALASSHLEKNADQFSTILDFESGALGNYFSHWYSPGGWSIRLFGDGVTVEFKPLENGRWMDTDFNVHEIKAEKEDIDFKPGFFRQIASFIKLIRSGRLEWPAQDLFESQKTMKLASKISGL